MKNHPRTHAAPFRFAVIPTWHSSEAGSASRRNSITNLHRRNSHLSLLAAAIMFTGCADITREEAPSRTVPLPAVVDELTTTTAPGEAVLTEPPVIEPVARTKVEAVQKRADNLPAGPAGLAREKANIALMEIDAGSTARQTAGKLIATAPAMADMRMPIAAQSPYNERYQSLNDNPVRQVLQEPVSTFSLDVDTGSYANVRRMINSGQLPPKDAVRIEEFVNYFPYAYPQARGEHPFGVGTELVVCPWNPQHWLLRVAVRADEVKAQAMPRANLVFLVDVSGSMNSPDKLPLLQKSLKLLVDQLRAQDRVSLVVYAGREAVVLEPTAGSEKLKISQAIDALSAGGSTAGEAGIRLAYRMAKQGFIKGGINRVLLATDGDFNVGVADTAQLKSLVERERASGVSLSTLGFGTGNYNEAMMEQIADIGNGNYSYIDTLQEGRKVLVDQMTSTLATVAKDVKVQVEFNPAVVGEYRLIGYENRLLNREDFNNDAIDAGDVGAGASVTALYELTPADAAQSVDALRYGSESVRSQAETKVLARAQEAAFVRVRYKQPEGTVSRLLEMPVHRSSLKASAGQASDDLRFATAVAGFGQLLRGASYTGAFGYDDVLALAGDARSSDEFGYRSEFLALVRMAKALQGS